MDYDESVEKEISDVESADKTGEGDENFADLLEKSDNLNTRLSPGQKVRAKVISISGDVVYIDLGGKSEGAVNLSEFTDEDGTVNVKEGDDIEAVFQSVKDGIRMLTTLSNGYPLIKLNAIYDAYNAGLPVDGEVRRELKGGFEISVGGVRCFCPFSHIDLKGGREGGIYLGRTFPFKVLEYENNGRNIIVSRRVLLEQEKRALVEKLKETLHTGMELTGTVTSIQKFGAFVDIGGIEALIPASEISWIRTVNPGDVLAVGQEVLAKVINLDWDNNRLTLSTKALQPDPWSNVGDRYQVDSRVKGTIVRLTGFGAFVNLEPGIDGLIHISNLGAGRHINHPKEVVEVGQEVEVYVREVDSGKRKISLSIQPKIDPVKIVLPAIGELFDGTVEKVMPYGIFMKIADGLSGLIPNSEMGTPGGTDHKSMFPPGTEMKVVVIEVDTKNSKVRLSKKAVKEKEAREDYDKYVNSGSRADGSTGGFGSLGEILKAKLEEKKLTG
ncbi:MAG: S1 RNA-binding domain-containing protein [Nitrospirota bacterium]|nr:S1 RNA-binding domain-containing protein [Nitrospirota bacterium]